MRNSVKYLLLALVLSSCSPYGSILLNTKKPADLHVPKDARTVCFAIRQAVTPEYNEFIRLNKKNQEMHDQNLRYYDITFEGFYDVMNRTKRFDRIMHYRDEIEVIPDSVEITPLNWVRAGQICARTGADILIVLEEADLKVTATEFQSQYEFSWDFILRVYDTYTFKILETYRTHDSSVIDFSMGGYSIESDIEYTAYNIGKEYARRLIPEDQIVERLYYNKGNKLIKLGTYYLKNKDYEKAFKIWKDALKEAKQNNEKYKIYMNLSLAEELRGNYNKALIYAKSASQYLLRAKHKEKDTKIIADRINELVKRIKYEKILNQ